VALTQHNKNPTVERPMGYHVTTQDFTKFWGNFFVFILLVLIENSQGFKTFWVYLKALFENYFKSSIYFLKNFFEKNKVSKYYFPSVIQTYASLLAKEWITNVFYLIKIVFLKDIFKHYYLLFSKDLFSNSIFIILCKQSH
jgi:hypothetical protein